MRKMKYTSYTKWLFFVIASTALFSACESDEWQVEQPQPTAANGLSILPSIIQGTNTNAATRAETVDAEATLNENLLNTLDVFVTNTGEDAIIHQWHLTNPDANLESTVKSLLESDWEKNTSLTKTGTYDIYVAANNTLTKEDQTTVRALNQLVVTDAGIQKTYKEDATESESTPFLPDKSFVMDGVYTGWQADDNAKEQVFKVDLKRAAAKIQVNIDFSQDFLDMLKYQYDEDKYNADGTLEFKTDEDGNKKEKDAQDQVTIGGTPAWRYVNFVSNAPVFTNGQFAEGETYAKIFRQTMYFGALNSIDGEDKSFSITTYSYPYQWEAETAINDAPFVMISVGFTKYDSNTGQNATTYYYYRIPVCNEKEVTSLDRNKVYIVNATIDSFGSAGDNVDQDVKLEYEVMEWTADNADNSNVLGKPLDFLMVSPLSTNIYGESGTATINVYVPNGKKVLVKDITATWKDASAATRTDKTSQTIPTEATDGKIVVSSTAMANHAVKTMTFRVYLEGHEELYHDVTVKHFPTESIQNFTGAWSSKITSGWVNWDEDANKTYSGNARKINGDDNFFAKVYDNGIIKGVVVNNNGYNKTYSLKYGNDYEDYYYWNGNSTSSKRTHFNATNNRMYVVQISSTSDTYILGKPILTKGYNNSTGLYTQSNDNVVSPAFMIASQLGAVSSFGTGNNAALNAAIHCTNYKEVGTDGKVYTGWRLPTAAEIAVIADRQNDDNYNPDVIVEVLGGQWYYNLSGGTTATGTNKNPNDRFVRCVRDLDDDDLKRINGE